MKKMLEVMISIVEVLIDGERAVEEINKQTL